MTSVKDIEWNTSSIISALVAVGFITLQVYLVGKHMVGLSMIGMLF